MEISVKIKKLSERARIPEYQTPCAAAVDLYALLDRPVTLSPGDSVLIPTGISLDCGGSVTALVFPRSGLASKHGITLANCVGVIDSDYRGEVKVALKNLGSSDFTVSDGDRIAQMGFFPVFKAAFVEQECLEDTERGEGGFGHTGVSN